MKVGICKFCGQEKELINSHIIPKCLLDIKNNGRLVNIDGQKKRIDVNPIHQNGAKEYLLCAKCDNELGKYENFAKNLFENVIPEIKPDIHMNDLYYRCLKLKYEDYIKFRKFFISMVWRDSVSSSHYNLGKYQDIALKILKDEISDDESLFLPIIYKKLTNSEFINTISSFCAGKCLGKRAITIKFPGHEVLVIINTKNSGNKELMESYKTYFSKEQILIGDIVKPTAIDRSQIKSFITCRNNTPGLKRPPID